MASLPEAASLPLLVRHRGNALLRRLFGPLVGACDGLAILLVALGSGIAYHEWTYGVVGSIERYLTYGGLVATIFCGANLIHGDYHVSRMLSIKVGAGRAVRSWTVTVLLVIAIGFLTKSGETYSRATVLLFYVAGLGTVAGLRLALVRLVQRGVAAGRVASRRVLLIGAERDVAAFVERYQPWNFGLHIAGTSLLRTDDGKPGAERHADLAGDLERAVITARALRPDDVFIVAPWSEKGVIEHCVDAFMNIPVSIHLAPEHILDRFDAIAIAKIGPMASLELSRPPLNAAEVLAKRAFDIVAALFGLVLLSPLFLVVAVLIKLDSRGPVFFLQRRYGFNQRPFRILKFRSMTALDDGHIVLQATKNDMRVTKVGAVLRRWNIDELPQLVNVLLGDMSIVGPRPHAVAHNRAFERRIALYARRHNVKPGITGWAQVNGFRGETDTEEKMRARVEHDLFYIDNWSFLLDLRICLKTLTSAKAFKNAY